MKIDLPSIAEQRAQVFELATKEAIKQLQANLKAPRIAAQTEIDESQYPTTHLLRESEGWDHPHPDIVGAYFRQFQHHFPEHGSDGRLAALLGLSSDRRVREFKSGHRKVPYGVWRQFLVMTGRAPQDVLPVFAYMG